MKSLPRGRSAEELGALCQLTPEQVAKAKERWLRDHPEIAAWFSKKHEGDCDCMSCRPWTT